MNNNHYLFIILFILYLFNHRVIAIEKQNDDENECTMMKQKQQQDEKNDEEIKDCGCSKGTNRQNNKGIHGIKNNYVAKELKNLLEKNMIVIPKIENPLVTIPGGLFIMGTDNPSIPEDGEGPARKIRISTFKIQQKEVSNAEFSEFILETDYQTSAEIFGWSFVFVSAISKNIANKITQAVAQTPWWLPVNGSNWLHPEGPDRNIYQENRWNHPVVHVSHIDAKKYCEWKGLRLPREAEFEYCLKGANTDVNVNRTYPWGDELYPKGSYRANLWQGKFPIENTAEDGYLYHCPVDAFGVQNEAGLYNILGNVWEWVADAWMTNHQRYRDQILEDPQFEAGYDKLDDPNVERVKRGGSYMCHESYCYRYRTVSRSSNSADSSAYNLGFRCALDDNHE